MTTPIFQAGSETKVNFVAETTSGTTPTTPAMIQLPFVKSDFELATTFYDDTSVYADRMEHFAIAGLRKVTGSLSGNASHTNFSGLFQTAMFNTWATNVLKTGKVWNTITLEEWHSDTATGKVATGCFVDKLAIKLPASGLASFDATISGMNLTATTAALAASPTAPVVEVPYTQCNATLQEGGATIAYMTSMDFTIDNKATVMDALGSQTPLAYTPGMSTISGTVAFWIPDNTMFTKYLNSTQTSLSVQLTDGTNTLTFNFPNVVYTAVKAPVQGQGAITQTFTFKALKDATTGSNLVITRSA